MADVVVIDGANYKICQAYGEVVVEGSNTHIRSSYTSSNVGSTHTVSSYTTKKFFIKNRNGKEVFFNIQEDCTPPMRNGHMIQVIWVIPESEKEWIYVLVRNTSLGEEFLNIKEVSDLFMKQLVTWMWLKILLGLVVAIIILFNTGALGWIAAFFVAYFVIMIFTMAKRVQNNQNDLVEEINKRRIK